MRGKLRTPLKFLISTLMMTLIVVMGATVYAAAQTVTVKPSPSGPIWFDDGTIGNWYCREKGKPGVFKNEAGEVVDVAEYKLLEDNLEIEPMTGYAFYEIGQDGTTSSDATKSDMQKIIWSSKYISEYFGHGTPTVVEPTSSSTGWEETSSLLPDGDINDNGIPDNKEPDFNPEEYARQHTETASDFYVRVQDFGRVHYGIFKRLKDQKQVFITETKKEDLKVMVDQIAGTYTVGPYTMKLNLDDKYNGKPEFERAKGILYNELMGGSGNVGYTDANKFVERLDIEGVNKKEGTKAIFVDSHGKEIKFPAFKAFDGTTNETEQFFVRFVPANDGQIDNTGDPQVRIKYIYDFPDAKIARYELHKISDEIAVGDTQSFSGKGSLKELFYKAFEDWFNSHISHDTSHDGKTSTYTYYVNGSIQFSNIEVFIYNGRATISVKVDDINQSFGKDNNSKEVKVDNGTWKDTTYNSDGTVDEPGHWEYPGDPDATDDVKNSLKEQCEKIINAIKVKYEISGNELGDNVQKCTLIMPPSDKIDDGFHLILVEPHWVESNTKLPGKEINEKLGGHVWYEGDGIKTGEPDGKYVAGQDILYAGMQVTLYEMNLDGTGAKVFAHAGVANPTVTDEKGEYKFEHLNPLKKYYVEFLYNGEYYQSTFYKYNIAGNYSNARDVDREAFNTRFTTIEADPEAYNHEGWHAAYAKETRLMKEDGSFIAGDYIPKYGQTNYESYNYKGALLYMDAWEFFRDAAVETKSYDNAYASLQTWLAGQGVGSTEIANVIQFMKHCMIKSTTYVKDPLGNYKCEGQEKVVYPVYNRFVLEDEANPPAKVETMTLDVTYYYLYSKLSDQSRYVDYGINARVNTNLVLQKDVYKATVFLNGQKEEYFYGQQGQLDGAGVWVVRQRASNVLYNGAHSYRKYVKASDLLMDAEATYENLFGGNQAVKNLDVLVTYRIDVANTGDTIASVDEIVDYYDADNYIFDGTLSGDTYNPTVYTNYKDTGAGEVENYYINSYQDSAKATSGDKNMKTDIKISNKSSQHKNHEAIKGANYNYQPIYVTLPTNTLEPSHYLSFFITFKATDPTKNVDDIKGIDLIDEDLQGNEKVGKRNIAEINGYSTKYKNGQLIPDYLEKTDAPKTKDVSGQNAGIIDINSKSGSLAKWDLTDDGLIKDADKPLPESSTINRLEDDTCIAPPFKLLVDNSDANIRRVKGYTFEDARTEKEDNAKVGDGVFKDGEDTKINGVTVQLVELVRNVDELNQFTGTYAGEYIWASETYDGQGNLVDITAGADRNDYYSGKGTDKVIINGPEGTILYVPQENLGEAEYSFASLPAGDFYIRFIYGDHVRTVLTNATDDTKIQLGDSEGNVKDYKLSELEAQVNTLVGSAGMNKKSYNGQDYKSTVYQSGISQNPLIVNGQQVDNYHGITRYTDNNGKNYINTIDNPTENRPSDNYSVNNIWNLSGQMNVNTAAMYMYNLGEDHKTANVSDAKDVYAYRERANRYSENVQNYKAEVLSSFERLVSADDDAEREQLQKQMLLELMDNTYIVAQSGIMDLEIEEDTTSLGNQQSSGNQGENPNARPYEVKDVDLGLVERPEAGLKIKKEVARFQIVLANGETLFDTDKSVNNVYFAKHTGHITGYDSLRMKKPEIGDNRKGSPRVIQVYMDDEIMTGSKVTITYKYTVTNVGEVDYKSKQFYYLGKKASDDQIVTTSASKVVDYLTNYLKYQDTYQENPTDWAVTSIENLIPSTTESGKDASKFAQDLTNHIYYKDATTYTNVLTTERLGNELVPEIQDKENSKTSLNLVVGTTISGDATVDGLLYNNLGEIVQVKNTAGRRMQYSRVGNQPIANQNYGNNTDRKYNTAFDLVTPTEIDADSAQLVRILPPTGENRQYLPIVIAAVGVVMILGIAIVVIRKRVLGSNTK